MGKTILVKSKKDIVKRVAENTKLSRKEAEAAVNEVFAEITETLADGGELSVNGFGKFEVKTRAARTGFNPLTKEPIEIAESRSPSFKAAKALKDLARTSLASPSRTGFFQPDVRKLKKLIKG